MADIVPVVGSVITNTTADNIETQYKAGAAILQAQACILDETVTPPVWQLTDINSATVTINCSSATAKIGVALNPALTGQPIHVQRAGPIVIGATLARNMPYALTGTPGGIGPVADLVALTGGSAYGVLLGFATSTTVLMLRINISGVTTP